MGIKERLLKRKIKSVAEKFTSNKNADKIASVIFDDDKEEIVDFNDNDSISKLDTWLDEQVEKANNQDSPQPVTDLDSMEKRINDIKSENEDN